MKLQLVHNNASILLNKRIVKNVHKIHAASSMLVCMCVLLLLFGMEVRGQGCMVEGGAEESRDVYDVTCRYEVSEVCDKS